MLFLRKIRSLKLKTKLNEKKYIFTKNLHRPINYWL